MDIWILQTGEPLHSDKGNPRPMRAMNLSNKLVERGHFTTKQNHTAPVFTKKLKFQKI